MSISEDDEHDYTLPELKCIACNLRPGKRIVCNDCGEEVVHYPAEKAHVPQDYAVPELICLACSRRIKRRFVCIHCNEPFVHFPVDKDGRDDFAFLAGARRRPPPLDELEMREQGCELPYPPPRPKPPARDWRDELCMRYEEVEPYADVSLALRKPDEDDERVYEHQLTVMLPKSWNRGEACADVAKILADAKDLIAKRIASEIEAESDGQCCSANAWPDAAYMIDI